MAGLCGCAVARGDRCGVEAGGSACNTVAIALLMSRTPASVPVCRLFITEFDAGRALGFPMRLFQCPPPAICRPTIPATIATIDPTFRADTGSLKYVMPAMLISATPQPAQMA